MELEEMKAIAISHYKTVLKDIEKRIKKSENKKEIEKLEKLKLSYSSVLAMDLGEK